MPADLYPFLIPGVLIALFGIVNLREFVYGQHFLQRFKAFSDLIKSIAVLLESYGDYVRNEHHITLAALFKEQRVILKTLQGRWFRFGDIDKAISTLSDRAVVLHKVVALEIARNMTLGSKP